MPCLPRITSYNVCYTKLLRVIITYNGKSFDVPFIERYFDIQLNQAHIDLRYILASLGYKGGLKSCEIQLGFNRGDLTDIDGFFAVLLWYDYLKNRNEKALETLLAYNIQDVLTLEMLMVNRITSYNVCYTKLLRARCEKCWIFLC